MLKKILRKQKKKIRKTPERAFFDIIQFMEIIAHRAWSEGRGENTITALHRSVDKGVRAVEIDVRMKSGDVILSHDETDKAEVLFKDFAQEAKGANVKLFIELKEKNKELFKAVASVIESLNMQDESFVFAFEDVARYFPWNDFEDIKKGVIVEYPWNIQKAVKKYNPYFIAMGWDNNMPWTRYAFRVYWSLFRIDALKQKFGVKVMVGVCRNEKQIKWLKNQCVDYITADLEYLQNTQL